MEKFLGGGIIADLRSEEEKGKDFIFGADNGLIKTILNPSCNWLPYIVRGEPQYSKKGDFLDCVSEALTNEVENVLNMMIVQSLIPQETINWLSANGYFNQNDGKIDLSSRGLGKMSGTDITRGNYLWKVVDTAKHCGFLPESKWPSNDMSMDWNTYYITPTQELFDLGLEFAKRILINYEFISTTSHELLKQAHQYCSPEVMGYAWPKPINDVYPAVSDQHNHAFVSLWEDFVDSLRYIQDSYPDYYNPTQPYYKKLAWDYVLYNQGIAIYINSNKKKTMDIRKEKNSIDIYLINADGSGKINLADKPTYEPLKQQFTEVSDGSLESIPTLGSYLFVNRKIN